MSTPTNSLPLKTDRTTIEQSDINDPIVQDVLNEFREELMTSKNNEDNGKHQQSTPQYQPIQQQPQQQQPQQYQQQYQQQHQQPHYNDVNNNYAKSVALEKNDNFPYFNIEIDIIKKSLVLVIISLLIYHTGIINNLYEKVPEYLHENLNTFDIYIKSITLFISIYLLTFFQYV